MSGSSFDEMVALNNITRAVSTGMACQEALDLISQQLAGVLDAETVLLFLPEEARGLVLRAASRAMPESVDGPIADGGLGSIALSEALAPAEAGPAAQAELFAVLQPWSPRCLLHAPLPLRGKAVPGAVIAVNRRGALSFDAGDASTLRLMSPWVALAVDNVRLDADVQRLAGAKAEFVSLVAHELKGPMTSIGGYAKLLGLGTLGEMSDTQKQFIDTIGRNVQRMDRLVNVLLDLSRLEAGRIKPDRQIVSLRSAIEEAVQKSMRRMDAKSIDLDWSPPPDVPLVRADPVRLVQILDDLVSNASLYTPDEGAITIQVRYPASDFLVPAEESAGYVEIEVQDSGIGIAAEDQPKIFTQLFRGDHPLVQEAAGTGLSLMVTRGLVALHGGRIGVSSRLGEGSRFCFVIPALAAEAHTDLA